MHLYCTGETTHKDWAMRFSNPLPRYAFPPFLAAILLITGCNPSELQSHQASQATNNRSPKSTASEEAWIVHQVSRFLVELGSFTKEGTPESTGLKVRQTWTPETGRGYEILVGKQATPINVGLGVWTPVTYSPLAKTVFGVIDPAKPEMPDGDFIKVMLSPGVSTFLAQDQRLSDFLTDHPHSASGHLQAALLLGTIALNDYSGEFRDIRIPLNRMTAHLAAADALGLEPNSDGRQLAESVRLTLCGLQSDALAYLEKLAVTNDKFLGEWIAVLRLRNTGDWTRDRDNAAKGQDALKFEYYHALVQSVGPKAGIEFLETASLEPNISYWRIANEVDLSVSEGHTFTKPMLGIELKEIAATAKTFGINPVSDNLDWLKSYTATPEGTSVHHADSNHNVIEVAGRGFFAGYQLRHLMQAAQKTFAFLNDDWGVRKDAKEFKSIITDQLPKTRYTPFLMRMIARTNAERVDANETCEAIIASTPEIVTPALWISLRDDENNRRVLSVPDHHGWFDPEVLPGSAFEIDDRLYKIGVGDENDVAWMKTLWERAPYGYAVARFNAYRENGETYENMNPSIAAKWMGGLPAYHLRAMRFVASSLKGQPEKYQAAMTKAAQLDPDLYIDLGIYLEDQGMTEAAAHAYLQAFEKAKDRIYMANYSLPLVRYLHATDNLSMARKVAQAAADVFSYRGLKALIWLQEQEGNWSKALETARKIDQRYNDDQPIAESICLIHRASADHQNPDTLSRNKILTKIFPHGLKNVAFKDFKVAPKRGVLFNGYSPKMSPFGLQTNMVVVALNGYETETFAQYRVIRELSDDPKMDLIVWDGSGYRASSGKLHDRKFDVDMVDYRK